MMTPLECKQAWDTVLSCYKTTRESSPKVTMQKIIDTLGEENTVEVFAVVTYIKKHDGRIDIYNKRLMGRILFHTDCVKQGSPMFYSGLDIIHPAHINQLITELKKMVLNG